ncbi:MAG: phage terminase large subunit family protein, partial [Deltaproteobacteria bacterium]|nr:phage terminase large subunit family protein [Deltaproteobacteria bacterium]
MDSKAVDMAMERMSHSAVQEYTSISTPTIPDFGIDKEYNESNQMVWMIKCKKCNTHTCLEIEFPECIGDNGLRLCKKCRQEIFPMDGEWVAKHPDRVESEGIWLSQLNSPYIDPADILKLYNDPPEGNIQEVYNSKLGMAYIAAENKLTKNDVYACCGQEAMATKSKILHVVIGGKLANERFQILKMARVTNFNDVHDLAQRFNVKAAVLDIEPETRAVRAFQAAEPYEVWLCDYTDNPASTARWREDDKTIMAFRTETCDTAHYLVSKEGRLEIPRKCDEVEEYAREMSNIAKVLEEDKETGARVYRYRKLGADHYFHTTAYF